MYQDPIADFLTRIRNAQAAKKEMVVAPSSKLKRHIANILLTEGYVQDVREETDGPKKQIIVTLKYDQKTPKIQEIRRVSKPGLRIYRKAHELPRVVSDFGFAIISTSAGVMTNKEARRRKLGGEVLCEVV
ncbi:30S ribosomal protein S8 [Candidatus Uhrbacteria bacterium]|nr:30S ribosomal protein S8 [Candidatus Uhrbacteria bacterium]MBD3284396.1 30S ribosomal protein S8 [Candidatus Uhrbacteria bacterium]